MSVTYLWGSNGFDRDLAAGEAIRKQPRQGANLNVNANNDYELAAA